MQVGSLWYDVTLDTSQLIRQRRVVESETEKAAASFNVITRAVKVYAAALAVLKLAGLADDHRLLAARVNVATGSIEAGARAMDELRAISTRTRTALQDNVQVFTRLNASIKQMGGTEADTLRITELLGKAITVSGASAAEKASAMIQFGQALGSGKLAGDELRSLLENAPYLMKQLADGLGVPIGALKQLGEEGKLTSDVVVNAMGKAAQQINRDFANFPVTVGAAMTVASDAVTRLIEKLDALAGNSAALTGIISGVSDVLGTFADMLGRVGDEADKTARARDVQTWSKDTARFLSYVADAADVTWQTLSVLGRNVSFVFGGIGREIGGIGAQVAAVMRGDFAGARAIGEAMRTEAQDRRRELDVADAKTLADRKTWGQQMRQAWEEGAGNYGNEGRNRAAPQTKLKAPPSAGDKEAGKLAARRAAAQAYYEGLLADARTGLAKIDAEEQKALEDNKRRAAQDAGNADIYARAKTAIVAKYARERALYEEEITKETSAFRIAMITDEEARVVAIRTEAIREADAAVKLGVKTFQQGEQAKVLAAFQANQALEDLAERDKRARFDGLYAKARDTEQRIALLRDESVRQAEAAYRRGRMTFEEAEAAKVQAARRAADELKMLEQERAQTRVDILGMRASAGGSDAQAALIRAQAEQAIQATLEAQQRDLANHQLYADKRAAIESEMHRRIGEMRAQANADAFASTAGALGQLTDALRSETGKQDAIYKAAFIAQKAYAIASAIVAIQAGVAKAADAPWPANLAAMASVIAATASIITTIKGTNYGGGRQFGGPASAGSLYRVNEGGRPEMFTASNGAQYMLPTRDGRVTSASRAGNQSSASAARPLQVVQHFHVSGPADMRTQQQLFAAAARGLNTASKRDN